jgi:chromosomal replication initiator protein
MELTASDLWSRVLETSRAGMPEQSFRTWLSGTRAVGMTGDELLIETPSDFHTEWVEDKFGPGLGDFAERHLGRRIRLVFRTAEDGHLPAVPDVELRPSAPEPHPGVRPAPPSGRGAMAAPPSHRAPSHPTEEEGRRHAPETPGSGAALNERYTFDRFVVGANNQLAAAASHAVAETPARIYNPLFIYGGVGLGKTHLMHAVGHEILRRHPERRVAYVSTERFMNELVGAIQTGTTGAFRRHYRQIDLLLMDDIHFLVRKESTQEEFFHTFNTLYDAGKQIILTSDRAPKDLPGVEERLVSRFEWGLVVDIKPPDYETRVAILRKKADDDGLVLEDDVIDYIARSCTSSVREIEGAVIKLLAYSSLKRQEVTEELAREALSGMLRGGGAGEAGGDRSRPSGSGTGWRKRGGCGPRGSSPGSGRRT